MHVQKSKDEVAKYYAEKIQKWDTIAQIQGT